MANVLVVDDAKIIRMKLKALFEELGHTVVGDAANGYEGIEMYKKTKPDLVTMDITMPGEQGIADGIEAVKHIVEFDSNAKVIMVTSHGEQDKVIKAIQSGASNYILKPITKDKLTEVLKKMEF